jgi:hypothetical protein
MYYYRSLKMAEPVDAIRGFLPDAGGVHQHFFDTAQLSSPEFPHVVKSFIYSSFK